MPPPPLPADNRALAAEEDSALSTITDLEQEISRVSRLRPGGGVALPPRPERSATDTQEAYLAKLQQHIAVLKKQLDEINGSLLGVKRPAPYRSKL